MYIYLIHAYWFFLVLLLNISITFIEISLEKWVCREKKSKFFCVYTNGMVEKVAHPFRSKTNNFILNKHRANRPERMELQLYWIFRVNFSDILMYSHSSLHLMREKRNIFPEIIYRNKFPDLTVLFIPFPVRYPSQDEGFPTILIRFFKNQNEKIKKT